MEQIVNAIYSNDIRLVKEIVTANPEIVHVTDNYTGFIPLMFAIVSIAHPYKLKMIRLLIEAGTNPNKLNNENQSSFDLANASLDDTTKAKVIEILASKRGNPIYFTKN